MYLETFFVICATSPLHTAVYSRSRKLNGRNDELKLYPKMHVAWRNKCLAPCLWYIDIVLCCAESKRQLSKLYDLALILWKSVENDYFYFIHWNLYPTYLVKHFTILYPNATLFIFQYSIWTKPPTLNNVVVEIVLVWSREKTAFSEINLFFIGAKV